MTSSPSTSSSSSSSTLPGGKSPPRPDACHSGHCKKLAPEYSAAAEVLAKNDPPYALAKVDATAEKALAEKSGLQGFPTTYYLGSGFEQPFPHHGSPPLYKTG